MRIAMISLDQVWENKAANRVACRQSLSRAAEDHADLVIFPEMTLTGFSMNVETIGEDAGQEETLGWFREQARAHQVAVVMGYVSRCTDGKGLNRAVMLDSEGTELGHYDKIHPFKLSGEDLNFHQGTKTTVCDFQSVACGLTICYDLRFPELYTQLSAAQSSMIITIASWPDHRILHWDTLLRARDIEHQVFMIGVNRTGSDPTGLKYVQSSVIYGPFGEIIEPIISDAGYDLCEINMAEVERVRQQFPFLQDRKRMREVT